MQQIDDFNIKEEEVKSSQESNNKNRRQKYKLQTQNYLFHIQIPKFIPSMNKVSILNFNLHKKYLIEDQKQQLPQPSFKQTSNRRNKSPQDTIKRLIKKGLVNYISPFSRSKSRLRFQGNKENVSMRHSQVSVAGNQTGCLNRFQSSSLFFTCSRGHGTSVKSKYRVHTEDKENGHLNTRQMINKAMKGGDCEEVLPTANHIFRDFRNISEQSLSRLNVENERRNFKLQLVHKVKYDSTWKKYPVLSKSKEKMKSEQSQGKRKGII